MEGIKIVADVLNIMQNTRRVLLERGSKNISSKEGQQDIRLGQLLDDAKNVIKEKFINITLE